VQTLNCMELTSIAGLADWSATTRTSAPPCAGGWTTAKGSTRFAWQYHWGTSGGPAVIWQ
jgi:hypothetical protein